MEIVNLRSCVQILHNLTKKSNSPQLFTEIYAIYLKTEKMAKPEKGIKKPVLRHLITQLANYTSRNEAENFRGEIKSAYEVLCSLHTKFLRGESQQRLWRIFEFLETQRNQ